MLWWFLNLFFHCFWTGSVIDLHQLRFGFLTFHGMHLVLWRVQLCRVRVCSCVRAGFSSGCRRGINLATSNNNDSVSLVAASQEFSTLYCCRWVSSLPIKPTSGYLVCSRRRSSKLRWYSGGFSSMLFIAKFILWDPYTFRCFLFSLLGLYFV